MGKVWATVLLFGIAAAVAVVWFFNGLVLERHGRSYWAPISEQTLWLDRSLRAALHRPLASDRAGPLLWRRIAPGFETAELPVLVDDTEVDRIFLARVDPTRFRFDLQNDPTNSLTSRWVDAAQPRRACSEWPVFRARRHTGNAGHNGGQARWAEHVRRSTRRLRFIVSAHADRGLGVRGLAHGLSRRADRLCVLSTLDCAGWSRARGTRQRLVSQSKLHCSGSKWADHYRHDEKRLLHIAAPRRFSQAFTVELADCAELGWWKGGVPRHRARRLQARDVRAMGGACERERSSATSAGQPADSQRIPRDDAADPRRLSSRRASAAE